RRACTGFIIPLCSVRPIQTGARCFAGGIGCIKHCDETCLRTQSRSESLHIARRTNSHWANFLPCHFVVSASGDYRMARSPRASRDQRKSSLNSVCARELANLGCSAVPLGVQG